MTTRTAARAAFVAALTGLTTTGARVFVGRNRPLDAADLPGLMIFSGDETVESVFANANRPATRRYKVRVDIMVKNLTAAETEADTILAEIESALFASVSANTLGNLVNGVVMTAVGEPELDDTQDKPCVRVPVFFEVMYS